MTYAKYNLIVDEADQFLYVEELYLVYPGRWELYRTKTYTSKIPIYKNNASTYSESHGCYIQRYWELKAAPKQFLINEGFKLKP